MTKGSVPIDGRAIQLEKLREIRLHHSRFSASPVYVFVPEPGAPGAPEAFISAREKQRAFAAAGFACEICRLGYDGTPRAIAQVENGLAYFIVQRPLSSDKVFGKWVGTAMDLDANVKDSAQVSALTDTVMRIVTPFFAWKLSNGFRSTIRVALVGSRGHFGREIEGQLGKCGVEVIGLDLGDDLSEVRLAHIVVSAVGKPGVITRSQLNGQKVLLVDVGYFYSESEGKGYGDFDPLCYECCEFYTPVPGGVGPLQVLTLVERAALRGDDLPYKPWTLPDTIFGQVTMP
jgi:methylenetetrahydrofolate dehydrogenase (NADP+)/methenyltetrahydrofolate cyclohydrolase